MTEPILPLGTIDLFPSLREIVRAASSNPDKLGVGFENDGRKHIRLVDKHVIAVSDGDRIASWAVPSLGELFRGERAPPADMEHYPPEYCDHFFFIEKHVLALSDVMGDRTDQEMEEIYAALRRRPDGRSLGAPHDFLWQVAALLLGCYSLSQAEFEALIGALLSSARKWGLRPISRYYLSYLRKNLDSAP